MASKPKYPVQTVERALDIIKHMAAQSDALGVSISELSREMGLGKSTIHRILDTLQYYGYVEKTDGNRYVLGWELYAIGQTIPKRNQLFSLAPPFLMELSRSTQETANLGILKQNETVIVSKIEGSRDGLRIDVNPGECESIHATALGKALICESSSDCVLELLKGKRQLVQYTPNTITTFERLLEEERIVRERGFAVDAEEFCMGLYCVSMPIRDYTGSIVAAVSVSTPTIRLTPEKKQENIRALQLCANGISRTLGYRG